MGDMIDEIIITRRCRSIGIADTCYLLASDSVFGANRLLHGNKAVKKYLIEDLLYLSKAAWYWGQMSAKEVDTRFRYEPIGTFLVRDSTDPRYIK